VERSRTDPYRVLQVDPSANQLVIQAAYRVLAQIFHPDVSGDEAEMKRINAAWEILGDPRRRKQYDIEVAGRHPGAAERRPSATAHRTSSTQSAYGQAPRSAPAAALDRADPPARPGRPDRRPPRRHPASRPTPRVVRTTTPVRRPAVPLGRSFGSAATTAGRSARSPVSIGRTSSGCAGFPRAAAWAMTSMP
jgi:curved DNA-binding protein CbpA